MRLATYTDYTLRVLIYLAVHRERRVTIEEIAEAYAISRNHLMKVVHHLGRAGLAITTRGRSGGICLGPEPDTISIGRIARDCEADSALVECFGPSNTCRITPVCQLRSALSQANEAFFKVLDGYTLADITQPQAPLRRLLHEGPLQ